MVATDTGDPATLTTVFNWLDEHQRLVPIR
jgi:hypothetical protein